MTQNEFFEIIGYLTSPVRNTKLDVETHPRTRQKFENNYFQRTGEVPIEDNVNYYIWDETTDKWGSEMRLYFNGNLSTMPTLLREIRVSSRPSSGYDHRVNNNEFVWRLIDHGFLLGNGQNTTRIRERVPEEHQSDFESGFNIV